ncbi:hypothetical protein [Sphingorhabdus sp.]|uniref:hypothetical protein n=1 Tax=Sphingorhabdus sp. TaxID=1902408 RepID=UPI0032B78CE4
MKTLFEYLQWAFERLVLTAIAILIAVGALIHWVSLDEDGPDGFFALAGVSLLGWAVFFAVAIWVLYRGYRILRDNRK